MKEIEAKIKLNDLSILDKQNLIQKKKVHVLDIYFDSNSLNFEKQDKVLRLRKENDKAYLAYKGPRQKHDHLVIREEIEPEVSSFDESLKILENLGFASASKVEKIRTYFSTNTYKSLSITVDHYPFIGTYLEAEGEEDEVYAFVKDLDVDKDKFIKENCTELFLNFCKASDLPFKNPKLEFTFEKEKELLSK